jgi:SHS2 domain-containing protein
LRKVTPDEDSMKHESGSSFEEIEHTADWALRIRGRDLCELLTNAACGMSHLLVPDVGALPRDVEEFFVIEADDAEGLLVNWLSELAYWAEMHGVVFCEFDVLSVTSSQLQVSARGGRTAHLQKHIKAVTYHNLAILKTDQGLEATVVFDV